MRDAERHVPLERRLLLVQPGPLLTNKDNFPKVPNSVNLPIKTTYQRCQLTNKDNLPNVPNSQWKETVNFCSCNQVETSTRRALTEEATEEEIPPSTQATASATEVKPYTHTNALLLPV